MFYQEFLPSTSLQSYVDSYWIAKCDFNGTKSKILPDGCMDVIFDFGNQSSNSFVENARVSGMMTAYRFVVSQQIATTIGIRFKPGQLCRLTKFPFGEIKNGTVPASEVLPNISQDFYDKLNHQDNQFDRIKWIDEYLVMQFSDSSDRRSSDMHSVCEAIENNFRALDLVQIAEQHHVSLRQLERKFKVSVGVTMKEFHAIVRFRKTLETITNQSQGSLMLAAFDHGYYDHAHLTKEFNKMAGINPSQL